MALYAHHAPRASFACPRVLYMRLCALALTPTSRTLQSTNDAQTSRHGEPSPTRLRDARSVPRHVCYTLALMQYSLAHVLLLFVFFRLSSCTLQESLCALRRRRSSRRHSCRSADRLRRSGDKSPSRQAATTATAARSLVRARVLHEATQSIQSVQAMCLPHRMRSNNSNSRQRRTVCQPTSLAAPSRSRRSRSADPARLNTTCSRRPIARLRRASLELQQRRRRQADSAKRAATRACSAASTAQCQEPRWRPPRQCQCGRRRASPTVKRSSSSHSRATTSRPGCLAHRRRRLLLSSATPTRRDRSPSAPHRPRQWTRAVQRALPLRHLRRSREPTVSAVAQGRSSCRLRCASTLSRGRQMISWTSSCAWQLTANRSLASQCTPLRASRRRQN